jgi:hypothetical protein
LIDSVSAALLFVPVRAAIWAFSDVREGYNEGYIMASKHWFKARSCWRIKWRVRDKVHQAYKKLEGDADRLLARVVLLEEASKSGLARQPEIHDWIERGWLDADEAIRAFPGWAETGARRRHTSDTDYAEILNRYEERALDGARPQSEDASEQYEPSPADR